MESGAAVSALGVSVPGAGVPFVAVMLPDWTGISVRVGVAKRTVGVRLGIIVGSRVGTRVNVGVRVGRAGAGVRVTVTV